MTRRLNRNRKRTEKAPKYPAGWTQIAPFAYVHVETGVLHLFIAEMLDAEGYLDTPENRETLTKAALEVFAREWPTARVYLKP